MFNSVPLDPDPGLYTNRHRVSGAGITAVTKGNTIVKKSKTALSRFLLLVLIGVGGNVFDQQADPRAMNDRELP